ncbi:hypothetical protein ACMC9I_01930 [Deinococcota bacterium DY0809b]
MHYFEQLVRFLLEREGFWARTSYRVNLTKEEKRMIGRPSSPRPEIDVLAYRPRENLLLIIEVKSYLDSPGVALEQIDTEFVRGEGYRLFKDEEYRRVMFGRLKSELVNEGAINGTVSMIPGMVVGKVKGDEEALERFFSQRGWFFWGPSQLVEKLALTADMGYTDNPFVYTAKLLIRNGFRSNR